MIGIYSIYNNVTNKYYIGQTINIQNRWMQHRSRLKHNKYENKHLQNSYNIYGEDCFEYSIVEECSIEELDEREKFYIQKYDSYHNGYNQDEGGAGYLGYKHTEEEIMKMRMVQNPKSILQLDRNLNIIAEWISSAQASKSLGFYKNGIDMVCQRKNRQKSIGGFILVYKDEYVNGNIDWDYYLNIKEPMRKRVSQYDFNMNLIKIYDSTYNTGVENGFNPSEISVVCNHKKKTYKKYVWRFTDEYSENEYKIDCETNFSKRPIVGARSISQYDLYGDFICSYDSITDAVRKTGFSKSSIGDCLSGKIEKSHNCVWKYN